MAGLGKDNGRLVLLLVGNYQWMGHRIESFKVVVWALPLRSFKYYGEA